MSSERKKVVIELSSNYSDCETCGIAYDEGAVIKLDGMEFGTPAGASCFGGCGTSLEQAIQDVFMHLGYDVTVVHDDEEYNYEQNSFDSE